MANPPVKVKKVSAYPIPVIVKTSAGNVNAQVVRVTLQGCLIEIPPSNLQPGNKFDVTFQLPVSNKWVNEPVVMIKLYSQWGGSASAKAAASGPEPVKPDPPGGPLTFGSPTAEGRAVVHLVEIHFQNLSLEARGAISQFLRAIKQT